MKLKTIYQLFILSSLSFLTTASLAQIIDGTHSFNKDTIYWPTASGFQLKKVFWGKTKGGYYHAANTFSAPEHGGTHLDAPIHFYEKGLTVEKIPLTQLTGPALVIDLSQKIQDQADYLISDSDIKNWEKQNRQITSDDIVFIHTGWSRFWNNKQKYLGTKKKKDLKNLHFPGLSQEAATYLAKKRIKGIGLDTASLDYGQSQDYIAHRILAEKNIYGLENVANLGEVPATGSKVIIAPMKIENGTGAPTRILFELK